jgi:ABC-type sugar transport system substrate-binding protein
MFKVFNKKAYLKYIVIMLVSVLVISGSYFMFFKQEKQITIAYVGVANSDPYWSLITNFINITATEKKIKFIDLSPDDLDIEYQKKSLQKAINMNVDGIVLGYGGDVEFIDEELDKIFDLKIPLFAVDAKIEHFAVDSFISVDNYESGILAGEHIIKKTEGYGTVLTITGNDNHINAIDRRAGIQNIIEKYNMDIIIKYSDWNETEVKEIVRDELDKDNNITAIFSWDYAILEVYDLLKERNLEDKIILVGFDGIADVVKKIDEGKISATIAQPVEIMARDGIESLLSVIEKKTIIRDRLIPGILIDEENAGKYYEIIYIE